VAAQSLAVHTMEGPTLLNFAWWFLCFSFGTDAKIVILHYASS
jgi:hypothetical protein